MNSPKLKLYYSPGCGYCHLVIRSAKQLEVPLELVDISRDRQALERLYEFRGRGTVPVLGIPNKNGAGEQLLGESRDIITYLKTVDALAGNPLRGP